MKLVMAGTGYVGLVAGACFADTGHVVTCVDSDARKVEALQRGHLPIYEEGLSEVVERCRREERLFFAVDGTHALREAEIVFTAVGTPPGPNGAADLSAVFEVARAVAQAGGCAKLLVLKSTVPVGTNARVTGLLRELGSTNIEVVSNPEFLKEGAALLDFRRPDRVIIGTRSDRAARIISSLYEPFVRTGAPILVMDPASAEISKYASNAMLATRISFMNTISGLCERVGADVEQVRHAVGADRRIGSAFLFPGLGYGGSCFPKDVQALAATARELKVPMPLLDAVEETNERQKRSMLHKLETAFEPLGGLSGKTFGLWGLAFKANTDDIRQSPALAVIAELAQRGARIQAHDPAAMTRAREELAGLIAHGTLQLATSMYAAADRAHALVIATEWAEYRNPDFARLRRLLQRPWIFDGRNMWDYRQMSSRGIVYRSIGRPDAHPGTASDGQS